VLDDRWGSLESGLSGVPLPGTSATGGVTATPSTPLAGVVTSASAGTPLSGFPSGSAPQTSNVVLDGLPTDDVKTKMRSVRVKVGGAESGNS